MGMAVVLFSDAKLFEQTDNTPLTEGQFETWWKSVNLF